MSGLILDRRIDETIVIGKDIRITVLKAKYGSVKLRIEAPRDISVWREEILERIAAQKESALCPATPL